MNWVVFVDGKIVGTVNGENEVEAIRKAEKKFAFLSPLTLMVEPNHLRRIATD